MLIKAKRGWELPESAVTPEAVYRDRRSLLKGLVAAPAIAAAGSVMPGMLRGAHAADDPSAQLYPAERNPAYTVDRAMSKYDDVTTYNNYYEFGSHKQIWSRAQDLEIRPWTVVIDGMVETDMRIGIDDLLKQVQLEERVYRHRCVETWSMTVPWTGFPMRALVEMAKPLSGAKFVAMQTAEQKDNMPGLRQFWYPWPYTEGLTIAEATNDVAFLATGLYGKPMPKQNGAPLRLAVPWKYGFKSVKSIVRFTFTDTMPATFWNDLQANEYGFWANVNPEVAHPRWSQATEWQLGGSEDDRIPTLLYNGYAEQVASLYPKDAGTEYFR